MTTDDMMILRSLLEKRSNAALLRETIVFAAERQHRAGGRGAHRRGARRAFAGYSRMAVPVLASMRCSASVTPSRSAGLFPMAADRCLS